MALSEFIKRRFQIVIELKIQEFIIENYHRKEIQVEVVKDINLTSLKVIPFSDGLHVIRLFVDTDSVIKLAIPSDEGVEVKELKHRFTVECLLDFRYGQQFEVIAIRDRYRVSFDKLKSLDSTLLPYVYPELYEERATLILKNYYPNALETPMAINVNDMIEELGLEVVQTELSSDGSILGKIKFNSGLSRVYSSSTKKYYFRRVEARTILIDHKKRNKYSQNMTLAHEATHAYLDKPHIEIKSYLAQVLSEEKHRSYFKDSKIWLEQHARSLPPRILMPKDAFCRKAIENLQKLAEETNQASFLDMLKCTIEELSEFFNVSKQAAKLRMIELGCPEARGLFNYIDGQYIADYAYNSARLKHNQTLEISKRDFVKLYQNNQEFRNLISSGDYIYVDSHVILNRSDLYYSIIKGYPLVLTEKALLELDRYALAFEIRKKGDDFDEDDEPSVLYLKHKSAYKIDFSYQGGLENSNKSRQHEAFIEQKKREKELLESLPGNFEKCMRMVKEYQDCTFNEIAEGVGCEEKTVKRLFSGESGSYQLFIFVMIYLQLPTQVIRHIVGYIRTTRPKKEEEVFYDIIIDSFPGQPVEFVKDFLQENGLKLKF